MRSLPATARAVLKLLGAGQAWAAETLLDDAIDRGLPMATARHLLRAHREGEAREMLEGWADDR